MYRFFYLREYLMMEKRGPFRPHLYAQLVLTSLATINLSVGSGLMMSMGINLNFFAVSLALFFVLSICHEKLFPEMASSEIKKEYERSNHRKFGNLIFYTYMFGSIIISSFALSTLGEIARQA